MRKLFVIFAILTSGVVALGQSNASDSETLKALLNEVRMLRQELRTNHGDCAASADCALPVAA